MKKVILALIFGFSVLFALSSTPALATYPNCVPNDTDPRCVIGGVDDPTGVPGTTGDEKLSNFMTTIIRLIFIVAAMVFAFMIIIGAFQWITSGGEKEAIAKARARLTHAIIGFILLALAFVIINVLSNITNIGVLSNNRFGNPQLPNQPTNPTINNPLTPDENNIGTPGFQQPVLPEDNTENTDPCCPPGSRRQNNQCVDIGSNLQVPELNPSRCSEEELRTRPVF